MIATLFVLMQVAAAPSATSASVVVPAAAAEKKVCRKRLDIGSLVRHTTICRTRKEWRRTEEDAKDHGRQMQNNPDPNGR